MKIPLSLLKKWIPIDTKPLSEIASALTSLGIEVDFVEEALPPFSSVTVAKILSAEPHPKSSKLQKLLVQENLCPKSKTYQVACGDLTVKKGDIVPFAKPGAFVQGKTIQTASVQGLLSEGMLLSAKEMGIAEENDQVFRLDESISLGTDLQTALHDPVFTLSLTPNLGHCQSALGIARELSAYFKLPLHAVDMAAKASSGKTAIFQPYIEDPKDCPRYSYAVMTNLQPVKTPFWLRLVLEKAGFGSFNPIVDVLNYVMLATGQPMHAFDYAAIEEPISIKRSLGESIHLLDGATKKVPAGSIGIYAKDTCLAIAGIMGSLDSSVTKNTQAVLLEAATFNPQKIRKTMQAVDLRSESALRFEKGIDPNAAVLALEMATHLLQKIAGGTCEGPIFTSSPDVSLRSVSLRKSRVNQILGAALSAAEIDELLTRLGMKITAKDANTSAISIPSFRNDLIAEIDLIEEIARLYGYDHLPSTPITPITPVDTPLGSIPTKQLGKIHHDPYFSFTLFLRKICLQLSLHEWITPDLISEQIAKITAHEALDESAFLKTLYAKSEDHAVLRASLLPSFLQVIAQNIRLGQSNLQGFEISKVHFWNDDTPVEMPVLGIALSGKKNGVFWKPPSEKYDFFSIKGYIDAIGKTTQNFSYAPSKHPHMHPERQANIFAKGQDIGVVGEVHPELLEAFSIKERVFFAEIQLAHLFTASSKPPEMVISPSSFPSSFRDKTCSVSALMPYGYIEKAIQSASCPILQNASVIDLFQKPEENIKHLTIRFVYQSKERTLSMEEIEKAHEDVQQSIDDAIKKWRDPNPETA